MHAPLLLLRGPDLVQVNLASPQVTCLKNAIPTAPSLATDWLGPGPEVSLWPMRCVGKSAEALGRAASLITRQAPRKGWPGAELVEDNVSTQTAEQKYGKSPTP